MNGIGFIGGGAMGEALIKGLLVKGIKAHTIMVSDKNNERLAYLKEKHGVVTVENNQELLGNCHIIVLAVKPQNLFESLQDLQGLTGDKILISILAGVKIAQIEGALPADSKVIRVVPNTPALIGQGTSALTGGTNVTTEDMQKATEIFSAVGSVSILPEGLLNAVTGLSGSGPAFVYLIIEALADGGVLAGLPRDLAYKLAAETVKGAAMMVTETKLHPGQLKDMVTSPAGTTIQGLLHMEKAGVRGALMETVVAAAKRAEQL